MYVEFTKGTYIVVKNEIMKNEILVYKNCYLSRRNNLSNVKRFGNVKETQINQTLNHILYFLKIVLIISIAYH